MPATRHILSLFILATLSTGVMAATEVASIDGRVIIGHVSVHGKTTLDEVVAALAKKSDASGAPFFKVTSVSSNNRLHGNAVILQ